MAKYRTKPREIEAVQWNGIQDYNSLPPEYHRHVGFSGTALHCYTKNGTVRAQPGCFLILGKEEVYPCTPEEFEKRYEPVTEEAEVPVPQEVASGHPQSVGRDDGQSNPGGSSTQA